MARRKGWRKWRRKGRRKWRRGSRESREIGGKEKMVKGRVEKMAEGRESKCMGWKGKGKGGHVLSTEDPKTQTHGSGVLKGKVEKNGERSGRHTTWCILPYLVLVLCLSFPQVPTKQEPLYNQLRIPHDRTPTRLFYIIHCYIHNIRVPWLISNHNKPITVPGTCFLTPLHTRSTIATYTIMLGSALSVLDNLPFAGAHVSVHDIL